jgi:hypothetical protein
MMGNQIIGSTTLSLNRPNSKIHISDYKQPKPIGLVQSI